MAKNVAASSDEIRTAQVKKDLDSWIGGTGPFCDSVVIVGGHGITTHTFAARLAREPAFAGRVVLAGPQKEESKRLIGGVSLRAKGADFLAHATGLTHSALIDTIANGRFGTASTRQVGAMATESDDGGWDFVRPGAWQNHSAKSERPIMYGFRNSRMAVAIRDTIADGAVTFVDEAPTNLQEALDLAPGKRPLIVNGSTDDQLLGNAPSAHRWGIVAAQVPFSSDGAMKGPLQSATTFAPLIRRDGTIDVGYYTPFYDALSPEASWYGIIARPVSSEELVGPCADRHKEAVTKELFGIGESLGLSPVDPGETLGVAAVPGASWKRTPAPSVPGTFELRQSCSAGIPAYYADGILCGAMGGVAAAEAIIRRRDPTVSANAAVARISRWNKLWWLETTQIPAVADGLMRMNVSAAMVYPHSSSYKWWASAA